MAPCSQAEATRRQISVQKSQFLQLSGNQGNNRFCSVPPTVTLRSINLKNCFSSSTSSFACQHLLMEFLLFRICSQCLSFDLSSFSSLLEGLSNRHHIPSAKLGLNQYIECYGKPTLLEKQGIWLCGRMFALFMHSHKNKLQRGCVHIYVSVWACLCVGEKTTSGIFPRSCILFETQSLTNLILPTQAQLSSKRVLWISICCSLPNDRILSVYHYYFYAWLNKF